MIIPYDPIEDDVDATANLFNERFAAIYDDHNGNISSENLKNGAVTEAKIADGAVTSSKLGFEKYTDDNGWLVTDLGLIKIATKSRAFTIGSVAPGAIGFVTVDNDTAPVGFSESTQYNVSITPYITNGNAWRWSINLETTKLTPTTKPVYKNTSSDTSNATGYLETWVIF